MPLYVMLSRLTDHGAKTIRDNPERIIEVDGQLGEMGLTVHQQYATLGRFDFVNIVEAEDDLVAARAALELAARGSVRIETLAAVPVEDLIGSLKGG